MKKRIFIFLIILISCLTSFSQSLEQKWSIESLYSKDFYNSELGSSAKYFKLNSLYFAQLGIGLNRYLNNSFDAGVNFKAGFFEYNIFKNNETRNRTDTSFLRKKVDFTIIGKYKFNNDYIISKKSPFEPYILLGIGFTRFDKKFETYNNYPKIDTESGGEIKLNVPIGFGLKFNVYKNVDIVYQTSYVLNFNDATDGVISDKKGIFDKTDNYLTLSLGVNIKLGLSREDFVINRIKNKMKNDFKYKWIVETFYSKDFYMSNLGNSFNHITSQSLYYGQANLSVYRFLNNYFDAGLNLGAGFFEYNIGNNYNLINRTDTSFTRKKLEINLLGKFKLNNGSILSTSSQVSPYLFSGLGINIWDQGFDTYNGKALHGKSITAKFNLPIGAGFKFNITNSFGIIYQASYNFNFYGKADGVEVNDSQLDNYLKQSIGVSFNIDNSTD